MAKTTKARDPTTPSKANSLRIEDHADKPRDRAMAEVVAAGVAGNAFTVVNFSSGTFGELSMTDCFYALKETASATSGGDLRAAETLLTAQAAALNAIFGEMARRAAMNMGEHLDTTERYMRLALKAQGQCRMTLETLATIKNPPVVFARQANISHGPQQVNNGDQNVTSTRTVAHAANQRTGQTELLEASDAQRMDARATGTASRADPRLEAVGAVHRPAHR